MNEPSVQIGLKEVYDKLCAVEDKVITLTPMAEKTADHEVRLRRVERWMWALPSSLLIVIVEAVYIITSHH